jgi:hypothetical protein
MTEEEINQCREVQRCLEAAESRTDLMNLLNEKGFCGKSLSLDRKGGCMVTATVFGRNIPGEVGGKIFDPDQLFKENE